MKKKSNGAEKNEPRPAARGAEGMKFNLYSLLHESLGFQLRLRRFIAGFFADAYLSRD